MNQTLHTEQDNRSSAGALGNPLRIEMTTADLLALKTIYQVEAVFILEKCILSAPGAEGEMIPLCRYRRIGDDQGEARWTFELISPYALRVLSCHVHLCQMIGRRIVFHATGLVCCFAGDVFAATFLEALAG